MVPAKAYTNGRRLPLGHEEEIGELKGRSQITARRAISSKRLYDRRFAMWWDTRKGLSAQCTGRETPKRSELPSGFVNVVRSGYLSSPPRRHFARECRRGPGPSAMPQH